MQQLEKMSDFFNARVDGYDEHMISEVEGCKDAYNMIATLVPKNCKNLLDLGCGTGLELENIYKIFPDVAVTGIDIAEKMLEKLKNKFHGKNIVLINGDYFEVDFGVGKYDCVISVETMHHFGRDIKNELYCRIRKALNNNGCYIECDYMVKMQDEEDFFFSENKRLRDENGITDEEYYHYDTPCTIDNQRTMLLNAGFSDVEQVFSQGNTVILVSKN